MGEGCIMPILNENLDWNQLAANPGVRQAFRGIPAKTLIPANEMLCRFITTTTDIKRIPGTDIFDPWWTEWGATVSMLDRWKTAKATPTDVIRAKLAVTTDFSQELDSLVQIILTKPVYAWKGIAQYQDDKNRGVTYIGGGSQFFLPNLASDSQGGSVPALHHVSGGLDAGQRQAE
jgi:hypothetical protein